MGGVTTSISSSGPPPTNVASGQYAGLYINASGEQATLTFNFTEEVSSFQFSFDAFSGVVNTPETIGNFTTNSGGNLTFNLISSSGINWNGSEIIAIAGLDNGTGVLKIESSKTFNSISFEHNQDVNNSGFGIDNIQLTIPEPSASALSLIGSLALILRRRK